jgi:hypothetical protein
MKIIYAYHNIYYLFISTINAISTQKWCKYWLVERHVISTCLGLKCFLIEQFQSNIYFCQHKTNTKIRGSNVWLCIFKNNCKHVYVHVPLLVWFKHIYLSSIAKQNLSTYIDHFWVRFLELTSTGVIWGNTIVTPE